MHKRISFMFLAITVIFLLVSCSEDKAADKQLLDNQEADIHNDPVNEYVGEVLDDNDYISALPEGNFDGYNYRILVRKGQTGTQYFEEPQTA